MFYVGYGNIIFFIHALSFELDFKEIFRENVILSIDIVFLVSYTV